MMEITVLASGSSGNAALIRTGNATLLVDAGLSARELGRRLETCGVLPGELDGILVTHEHGDHARGLAQWSKTHSTPVYCNRRTALILQEKVTEFGGWRIFETGSDFTVAGAAVQSFAIPHDAVDPVGFVIRDAGVSFGFLTDLGHATTLVIEALRGVEALLVEANYDEELLQKDTKRPWATKQRIQSRHGHLSNAAAAETVARLRHDGLAHLLLGHLSRDCNSEALALSAVRPVLEGSSTTVACASDDGVTPAIRLG
jgi:phosphoribosyl 1,2-cyclic phosphodiesterase